MVRDALVAGPSDGLQGAPWWAVLLARFGFTAAIAAAMLWFLMDHLQTLPKVVDKQGDKIAQAIKDGSQIQLQAIEAAERRAEERARLHVERILAEIHKAK